MPKRIEKQRSILDFTLSSLMRRKAKNFSLFLVYSLVVFLLGSAMFFIQGMKREASLILKEAPEMVIQRILCGRYESIPFGLPAAVATDIIVTVRNQKELITIAKKISEILPDTRPIIRNEMIRTYDSVFDWARRNFYCSYFYGAAIYCCYYNTLMESSNNRPRCGDEVIVMINLLNVRKGFNLGKLNEFIAVSGITLTIEANRITVFKGPSGSGKTTLLSLIGCMARPTSGRIELAGELSSVNDILNNGAANKLEVTSLPERFLTEIRRRMFGFIFQQFNLIKGITVLENIMLPSYPLGRKYASAKQRARTLMDTFGIGAMASAKVEWLSGGEAQRVAIARALILVSFIITGMILYCSYFGIIIIRHWDIKSGSEEQLALERRTYLISTIISYMLVFQIASLFIYIYTADSLHNMFIGAMCAELAPLMSISTDIQLLY